MREALRALEKKLQDEASNARATFKNGGGEYYDGRSDAFNLAASELAAILSARQEVAPVAFDRDLVMQHAEFRACLYALVGIVEGVQGQGRKWVSGGQRLKDTPEWTKFYVMANAIRDGRLPLASTGQTSDARDAAAMELVAAAKQHIDAEPMSWQSADAFKRLTKAIAAMEAIR